MKKYLFAFFLLHTFLSHAQLNLQQLAHVPNDSGITLAGCWHYVDSSANEYALVGHRLGLDIYDVSVPTAPVRRFRIPGLVNNWREVKVWNGFAYVGSEADGSGITIVDMRSLPDTVYYKVFTGEGAMANLIQRSHTVGAVDEYLYVYGSTAPNNGAIIFSLEDPWNPVYIGQYNQNYLHDGFVRGDTLWGSQIYSGQFSAVDISDKTNPVLLATQPTPALFNHNAELSKNGQFIFTTDEKPFAPLGAFDVSDLSNITRTDLYFPSQRPSGEVHNVRVVGDDWLVCPSYQGQLTIVDASDPYNLIETAWAIVGNSLVWDADPYLPSGIVFATAKAEGFFVFQPTYVRAARLKGVVTDATTGQPLLDAKVFVETTTNADTTGIDGQYATGAATSGTYTIRAERAGYVSLLLSQPLQTGTVATLNISLYPEPVNTIDPGHANSQFYIYPNLVKDHFNVVDRGANSTSSRVLQVFNAQQQLVYSETLTQSNTRIQLNLPPGAYSGIVGNNTFKIIVVN